MLDKYIEKGGKKLRYGYTTGSCAAAATKGAAMMLFEKKVVTELSLETPKGWTLQLELFNTTFNDDYASCAVIKDAGDDPDVTDGIRVFSKVKRVPDAGVIFKAGVGVGKVTLKGLSVPVGEPAINPVPRDMIRKELSKISEKYGYTGGYEVEISMPEGVELAKRTFNPKLGIVGGLSIVGTSGIVEPMSEEALKESIALELSILKEKGFKNIIMVPGNYGKDFVETLNLNEEALVKTSNFVGFVLERSERLEFKNILFVGHLGKLVKVAGGIFNTHSAVADGRMEILAANLALLGGNRETVEKIMNSKTTDEATAYIFAEKIDGYFDYLATAVKKRCMGKVYNNINIEVILFSNENGLLGKTDGADEMVKLLCIN